MIENSSCSTRTSRSPPTVARSQAGSIQSTEVKAVVVSGASTTRTTGSVGRVGAGSGGAGRSPRSAKPENASTIIASTSPGSTSPTATTVMRSGRYQSS